MNFGILNFQYTLYKEIIKNISKFINHIKEPKLIGPKQFKKRTEYNILALLRKEYLGGTAFINFEKDMRTCAFYIDILLRNPNFYRNCKFMPLCEALFKENFTIIEFNKFEKIIILIDDLNNHQSKCALNFCKKVFNHPKFEFIVVKKEEKVDKILKDGSFSLYVDHDLNNIRRIAEKIQSLKGKEFMIPRYGYNKMPIDLSMLIHGKNGAFAYFDN